MSKVALITGITGQDGAYLARLLLDKNYTVYGAYRRSSTNKERFWRIEALKVNQHADFHLVEYDLTDMGAAIRLLQKVKPDEVYNLAAQSFVAVSFEQPVTTAEINAIGPLNLLEAIRLVDVNIKFYQASTSEMFGKVQEIPQTEQTPLYPRSPYGVAKVFAHWMTINYQESYGIFATSGILFNHESPLRGSEFVTRKITQAVANIYLGKQEKVELGNLEAKRDWGYAGEYVEGMWRMLQVDKPRSYILATGRTKKVRDFVEMAFKAVDIKIQWQGKGVNEVGLDSKTGKVRVSINPDFYRPAEIDLLIGSPKKAEKYLGWKPKTTLEQLCKMMVDADLKRSQSAQIN